jgi:hypothetical protein
MAAVPNGSDRNRLPVAAKIAPVRGTALPGWRVAAAWVETAASKPAIGTVRYGTE